MSDLIDTTEMYLKTVYELEEEGVVPLRARIAERLGHSGPTVSQTVARMERDGLLVLTGNRQLRLTDEGRARATKVMRKHRLAERLLTDVVGLDWPFVHEEACRWEHVMSERVERRLVELLGHPRVDPYGNPIPGLEHLGDDALATLPHVEVRSLADVAAERVPAGAVGATRSVVVHAAVTGAAVAHAAGGAGAESQTVPFEVELARIGEPLQVDVDLLGRMADAGLRPGVRVEVTVRPELELVSLHAPGSDTVLDLPEDITRHLFVTR
ncbi:metal-dependent transcriptional regulator [Georgenia yuyongxinii]|uniref:Metal-dependent transcriptional regulator n=1 Tax=Georgenia yuyongxinii TaxID=2589797 RepID=A0A5B8BZU9_9MICO|nr:metal-dependent transcriptional regulator [Georgenia yuyongxinii]QDC23738.1 metal-dependent transcriptional regulator [Georgenia yuyongxinii]